MNADVERAVELDELKSAEIKFAQLAWRKALSEEDGYAGASKLMTECFRDGFYAGVRTYWDRVDALHTERVQATQALRDQEAEIARLRKASWQPIATAPTDGTYIVGIDPDFIGDDELSACQIVRFDHGVWLYAGGEYAHMAKFWLPIQAFVLPQKDC